MSAARYLTRDRVAEAFRTYRAARDAGDLHAEREAIHDITRAVRDSRHWASTPEFYAGCALRLRELASAIAADRWGRAVVVTAAPEAP